MAKNKANVTPAIRLLRQHKVNFGECPYQYEEKGGAKAAAEKLQLAEYAVVKTLVMEDERSYPFIILMHGNQAVSHKAMARTLACKSVRMCSTQTANKLTGYMVGGTSPFATRTPLPVYIEKTILELEKIWINAGKRGLLLEIATADLVTLLKPTVVNVTRES